MTACPGLVNPTSSLLLLITFSFLWLFLYALSWSQHKIRNTIQLIMIHWSVYSWHWLLDCPKIYLSNCPLKQSFSSTRSCAKTVSAACSTSHWSKFNMSQTWSARGRASTTQRPWLIERFLWRMFATSYWLTLSAWWTTSHNLVYDSSIPARTGWISTPPTRYTTTLSFNWEMVRMIVSWTRESFRWDTALAGTHRKGDKFLRKRSMKKEEHEPGSGWSSPMEEDHSTPSLLLPPQEKPQSSSPSIWSGDNHCSLWCRSLSDHHFVIVAKLGWSSEWVLSTTYCHVGSGSSEEITPPTR